MKKIINITCIIILIIPLAAFGRYDSKTQKLIVDKFNYNLFSNSAKLTDEGWNSIKDEYLIFVDEDIHFDSISFKLKYNLENIKYAISKTVLIDNNPAPEKFLISMKLEKMVDYTRIPSVKSSIENFSVYLFNLEWILSDVPNSGKRKYSFMNFSMEKGTDEIIMFSLNAHGMVFNEFYNNTELNSFFLYDFSPGICIPLFYSNGSKFEESKFNHIRSISSNQIDEISFASTIENAFALRIYFGTVNFLGYAPKNTVLEDILNIEYPINASLSMQIKSFNIDLGTSYLDGAFSPFISVKFNVQKGIAFSKIKF